jgi:hypothetical protein
MSFLQSLRPYELGRGGTPHYLDGLLHYFTVLVLKCPLPRASQRIHHPANIDIADEMAGGGDFLIPLHDQPGHSHQYCSLPGGMAGTFCTQYIIATPSLGRRPVLQDLAPRREVFGGNWTLGLAAA